MSGKTGKRLTGRKPDTVRQQGAKTDGAFGKETLNEVIPERNRNEDKAVKKAARVRRAGG